MTRHADRVGLDARARAAARASRAGPAAARAGRRSRGVAALVGSGVCSVVTRRSILPERSTRRVSRQPPGWRGTGPGGQRRRAGVSARQATQVEGEVEDRRRVGQRADRHVVDARRGDLGGAVERQVARSPRARRGRSVASPARTAATVSARTAAVMLSSSRNRAPAATASSAWASVSASTWTATSGNASRTARDGRRHRARRRPRGCP